MIGLIQNEIERDLTQRAAVSEVPNDSEEVGEKPEKQESTDISGDFDSENEDLDNEPDESEDQGMSMGM